MSQPQHSHWLTLAHQLISHVFRTHRWSPDRTLSWCTLSPPSFGLCTEPNAFFLSRHAFCPKLFSSRSSRESSAVVDPRAVTQITQRQVFRKPMAKRLIIATFPSYFLLKYTWSLALVLCETRRSSDRDRCRSPTHSCMTAVPKASMRLDSTSPSAFERSLNPSSRIVIVFPSANSFAKTAKTSQSFPLGCCVLALVHLPSLFLKCNQPLFVSPPRTASNPGTLTSTRLLGSSSFSSIS